MVQTVLDTAGAAVTAAVGAGGSSNRRSQQQQLNAGDSSSVLEGSDNKEGDQDELLRRLELEEFDRRLDSKSRSKS